MQNRNRTVRHYLSWCARRLGPVTALAAILVLGLVQPSVAAKNTRPTNPPAPATTSTTTTTTTTTVPPPPKTSAPASSDANTTGQMAAIPAYWYPDSANSASTAQVLNTHGGDISFIIADVTSSGAGLSVDPNWASAIAAYERAGIKVFGYVDTEYAKRSLSSVETDVSDWYSWYGVNGIFFDEASITPALAGPGSYYNELYEYVKDSTGHGVLGTTVVLNPGTVTSQSYMADADIICDFEGTEATYMTATFPAWSNGYPAARFWNIVYASAGVAQMEHDIALASARHAGYVFVTTLGGWNPYGAMPSSAFWKAEVSALASP